PAPVAVAWSVPDPMVSASDGVLQPASTAAAWSIPDPALAAGVIEATPDPVAVAWSVVDPVLVPGAASMLHTPLVGLIAIRTPTLVAGQIVDRRYALESRITTRVDLGSEAASDMVSAISGISLYSDIDPDADQG